MKLNNDFFTYPVLNNDSDDYVNSEFYSSLDISLDSPTKLKISCSFSVSDDEINKRLSKGVFAYALHIEGVSSTFRKIYIFDNNEAHKDIFIDINNINNKIEVSPIIIATKHVNDYSNINFNSLYYKEDYKVENIQKGDIIAYENTVTIDLDFEDLFESRSGTIVRVEKDIKNNYVSYENSGDNIIIKLPNEVYDTYVSFSKNKNKSYRKLMMGYFILPSIALCIEDLKSGNYISELKWVQVLLSVSEKYGEEINSNTDSLMLAQKILDYPVNESIKAIGDYEDE